MLLICLIVMLLTSCGRSTSPQPPASVTTLTAGQVFSRSMIGQTWTFTNTLGDQTFITVEQPPAPVDSSCVVFHYSKNRARAYWQPGSVNAELRFVICPRPDGSWISRGSLMHGDTDIAGNPSPWIITSNVTQIPGMPQGYVIIPASGTEQNASLITQFRNYSLQGIETFNSIIGDLATSVRDVTWRTDSRIEVTTVPFHGFRGNALISEQWENCDSTWNGPQGCVHEKWYFAPGLGLVQVDIKNMGNGEGAGFCTLDLGVKNCYSVQDISFKRTL